MRRGCAFMAVALVAGCADIGKPSAPAPAAPTAGLGQEAAAAPESPKFSNATLKYLAGRNLKPQPTRPLNVKSRCTHRDAIGTVTRLDLLVKESEVKGFSAQVTMKGHGACRFDLADFEQIDRLPQPLLRHRRDGDCLVRMWEQGKQMTIAFNSCPKACEGDAFNYLWPILVEAKTGRCF